MIESTGYREIGHRHVSEVILGVDHVFDTTDGTDPGAVSMLVLHENVPEDCDHTAGQVFLGPDEALWLANRLTRAANLVLESIEDRACADRELARLSGQGAE